MVIPTYRRAERLPELFEALSAQSLGPHRFEALIVDDCSNDGTAQLLGRLAKEAPFPTRALRTAINSGPARARNLGWHEAIAPFVAFTDDDCLPAPGWLSAGLAALVADKRLGVVQGSTQAPDGFHPKDFGDHYLWRVISEATPYFEGCNIFYRREALSAAGGFDEDIAWWGEDTAAGWRVIEAGWTRGFANEAVVVHSVERRGWRWFIAQGAMECNVVRLASEHPGYRVEAFWRPWAYRRTDAAFALAMVAAAASFRWRPAAGGALPYLWWRRPSVRRPHFVRLCLQTPVVDAARVMGHLKGSIRQRILVV